MNQHQSNIKFLEFIFIILFFVNPLHSQSINLIDENTTVRVLIPEATVSATWRSSLNFNDDSWMTGTGGIGYGSEYDQFINIPVGDKMYNSSGTPDKSCMVRIKFNVTQEQILKARKLMLYLRYDDGYALYLNGGLISSNNAPGSPKYNSLSTGEHNSGTEPEEFNLIYNYLYEVYRSAVSILRVGENLLAIQGFNLSADDQDFLLNIKLVLEIFGEPPLFESSNLPIVIINTNGSEIPNDERIIADMGIIDNGPGQRNEVTDQFNGYNGKISIEVHGSSSVSYPKKSYNIETQDDLGNNNNVSLLGLPEENDWILYSIYSDKTLMRDVLMYRLSNMMGRYASRSRYCELLLNGEYTGVYALLEKVKRDKDRIDISNLDADDIQGDSLTGGYIIKLDQRDPNNDFFISAYPPYPNASQQIQYQYHYPKSDEIKEEQKQYIKGFIDAFESTMDGPNYADPDNGYSKYIDEDSFVDNFILTEICKNVDGYRLSSFFYKERDNKGGKFHAGPIWDMNFSLGNAGYYGADSTKGWELDELSLGTLIRSDLTLPPFWWEKLVREPQFANRIMQRWQSLRSGILAKNEIEALIDSFADSVMEAKERNFKVFSGPGDAGTGFWVTPKIFYSFNTYQDEIDYLKQWLNDRMNWMDENLPLLTGIGENYINNIPEEFSLRQNYPNPFNPSTEIKYQIPTAGLVSIKVFDILGREVETLVNDTKEAGYYSTKFDGSKFASGVYFARLIVKTTNSKPVVKTIKMLMTK